MLQQHMYSYGDEVIVFPKSKIFRRVTQKCHHRFSRNTQKIFFFEFSEFLDKRIFSIYIRVLKLCQCKKFWQFVRCKHELAVKLKFKELKVSWSKYVIKIDKVPDE